MKYNLTEIKLRKVADGKRNSGTLFVQATVVNPDDMWDEDGQLTTFNPRLVKAFSQYLALSQPGPADAFGRQTWLPSMLLDQTKPIPEALLVLTGAQFEEFVFPGGVPHVSLNDDGTPRRNEHGQFYQRTSIRVLTKKSVDNETGERRYANGWDPVSQGTSIMNNLYAPLSNFTTEEPGVPLPQQPDTPLINGATAQQQMQQQQMPQQGMQQTPQQPGVQQTAF